MINEVITEGDDVLLFLDSKRTYLVKAEQGKQFHTHKGVICFDTIIGMAWGDQVKTHLGIEFILFKPNINDYLRKMRHATQVVYSKDIALIINYSNIGPGSRVVEAGTGSGVLTSALAHYIQPTGKVYSYEIRSEFLDHARKNIERTGLLKYVELKEQNIILGIDEENVDSIILDLATPWQVVSYAYHSLKPGGNFVAFSPTIEQTVKTTNALVEEGFVDVMTVESIVRRMKVKEGQTRPETLMIGHTGYITSARRTCKRS